MAKADHHISCQPVDFNSLPGWRGDNHLAAFAAFGRSCAPVMRNLARLAIQTKTNPEVKAKFETDRNAGNLTADLCAVCQKATDLISSHRRDDTNISSEQARLFFESHFIPHKVEAVPSNGFLTGYYEPVLEGSRVKTSKFQTPIHARPADLVNLVEEQDRAGIGNGLTHARQVAAGLEPYPSRKKIERGFLDGRGLELFYLADPVDVFFLHVQGSGLIKLPDSEMVRVTYDGKNGRPYTSIGQYLIKQGVIGAKSMSLQVLGDWLRADPARGHKVMRRNKSYIFFRELQGDEAGAPHGVMNVPLTPGRSLAIDPRYHAMGLPLYIAAPELPVPGAGQSGTDAGPGFHRLMIAQDVGSAIKGPERGDIFFGTGDAAGALAGVTKANGTFYILQPRGAGLDSGSIGTSFAAQQRSDPGARG